MLLIIGARPIGLEFAQLFRRFGVEVTVLEALSRIAPTEEAEIAQALAGYLEEEGVRIHTGLRITGVEKSPSGKVVTAEAEGTTRRFAAGWPSAFGSPCRTCSTLSTPI